MNKEELKNYYQERTNSKPQKNSEQEPNKNKETTLVKIDTACFVEEIELPPDWDIEHFNKTGSFEKEK